MAQVLTQDDIKIVRNYGKGLTKVHGLVSRMVKSVETREGLRDLLAQSLCDLQGQKDWPWEGGRPCGVNGLRNAGNHLAIGYNRLQSAANIAWKRLHPPAPKTPSVVTDPGTVTTVEQQAKAVCWPEYINVAYTVAACPDGQLADLLATVKAEIAARKK